MNTVVACTRTAVTKSAACPVVGPMSSATASNRTVTLLPSRVTLCGAIGTISSDTRAPVGCLSTLIVTCGTAMSPTMISRDGLRTSMRVLSARASATETKSIGTWYTPLRSRAVGAESETTRPLTCAKFCPGTSRIF